MVQSQIVDTVCGPNFCGDQSKTPDLRVRVLAIYLSRTENSYLQPPGTSMYGMGDSEVTLLNSSDTTIYVQKTMVKLGYSGLHSIHIVTALHPALATG